MAMKGEHRVMSDKELEARYRAITSQVSVLRVIIGMSVIICIELIYVIFEVRIRFVNSVLGGVVGWELFAKRRKQKWSKVIITVLSIFLLPLLVFLIVALGVGGWIYLFGGRS